MSITVTFSYPTYPPYLPYLPWQAIEKPAAC
jgi:hypothetical protein